MVSYHANGNLTSRKRKKAEFFPSEGETQTRIREKFSFLFPLPDLKKAKKAIQ